ncbi:hypothetical protein EOK75_03010 [Pseudorhodobacter turbinis]|uniref:Uncharacterized protein n=1 Tax=Pseudorhodobacter turbinis TaxID=2500533 RepID=A0A4P8EDT2_9RHOB|nr:hypothetical protein [Pseudorhodobacter turbinis]QCO54847.1 hypothetical protein EOK75_03010 [Pseudorhodobacter turbinis]
MIYRESFKATSISLPSNLTERLQELSASVGEPVATVQRQVIRAAYRGRWTWEVLGAEASSGEASERCVVRLSLSPRLTDQTLELRGAVPLSTWYRAALIKFLALHDSGNLTIWNLGG